MKQTPTKQQYEAALETIHLYEKRQEQLNYVKKQLAKKLKQFKQVKFKVNKKEREIIFSGLHAKTNKLLLSKSVCAYNDQFDVNIGKLIVVKKALGEDIESIVELVEKTNLGGFGINNNELIKLNTNLEAPVILS